MRILHTADWHLGAKTDDLDRTEEIKEALKQLIDTANNYQVDMVLIAGDVYENIVPSAEDEELFYETVVELSRNGNCAVVAIAGNHDDPKRLSNANIFADKFGIYLVGYTDQIKIDTSKTDTNIFAVASGKGYIEFQTQNGEHCVLALLPYPNYYRYKDVKKSGDNFQDKVKSWLQPGVSHFRDDTINITMAHALSYGINMDSDALESFEQISAPTNFIDQKTLQTGAHYTALGHIHQCMAVNSEKNIFYSGSLINQFFSPRNDQPTSVMIVDLDKNGVHNIIQQPLQVKALKKFVVNSVIDAHKILNDNPQDLIKIIIEDVDNTDEDVDNSKYTPFISQKDLKELRKQHPNLVTLSVITNQAKATKDYISKKDLTNAEIFDHFYKEKMGTLPEPELKELFLSLMSEGLYEAD